MRVAALLILSLSLAGTVGGCATLPATQNTPYLPAGVFGTYEDNDIGAINQSARAFASPANTRGNPVAAVRAIIALEYLPGELQENPRWAGMGDSISFRLGQARQDVRQIVGIRPEAPPQLVVNTLLALNWDLQTGNRSAAMDVLASPIFENPPAVTLRKLSDLPYVQTANLATARAEAQEFPLGGPRG